MVTWLKAVASCRFLFNMGQGKSRAYIINGLAMLASFFLFRNVLGVGVAPAGSGCDELTMLSVVRISCAAVRWLSGLVYDIAFPSVMLGNFTATSQGSATCCYDSRIAMSADLWLAYPVFVLGAAPANCWNATWPVQWTLFSLPGN